jgi:hypothetical protein
MPCRLVKSFEQFYEQVSRNCAHCTYVEAQEVRMNQPEAGLYPLPPRPAAFCAAATTALSSSFLP